MYGSVWNMYVEYYIPVSKWLLPTPHMRLNQTQHAATACSSFLVYAVAHQYLVHGGVWPVGSS